MRLCWSANGRAKANPQSAFCVSYPIQTQRPRNAQAHDAMIEGQAAHAPDRADRAVWERDDHGIMSTEPTGYASLDTRAVSAG